MDLGELRERVANVRAERGFTTDPVRVLTLLVEEVGEVARELKRTWSPNYDAFSVERLASELADVQTLLLALAHEYDIDLEAAVMAKLERDGEREWKSRRAAGDEA